MALLYQRIAHRYGELTMLLLGESVLSMILAPVKNRSKYYITFFVGLATVQLLRFVHFGSEEFDPEKYALARKLRAGRIWMELMTGYGIGLIALGVGLKALLYSVVCADNDRRL